MLALQRLGDQLKHRRAKLAAARNPEMECGRARIAAVGQRRENQNKPQQASADFLSYTAQFLELMTITSKFCTRLQTSDLIKIKYATHRWPVIQERVVDMGLTIKRLKPIAHGGRVSSSIPAQAGTSERSSPVAGAGNNNAEDGIEARGNSQPAFVKVIRRVSDPGF